MNMYEPNLFERGLGEKEKKQLPCIIQTETVYLKNPQKKTNIPGENLTVGKFSRSKFGTIFMTHTIHVWHIFTHILLVFHGCKHRKNVGIFTIPSWWFQPI